ncbi:unnamed protein product [Lampetra fluviatilis]
MSRGYRRIIARWGLIPGGRAPGRLFKQRTETGKRGVTDTHVHAPGAQGQLKGSSGEAQEQLMGGSMAAERQLRGSSMQAQEAAQGHLRGSSEAAHGQLDGS